MNNLEGDVDNSNNSDMDIKLEIDVKDEIIESWKMYLGSRNYVSSYTSQPEAHVCGSELVTTEEENEADAHKMNVNLTRFKVKFEDSSPKKIKKSDLALSDSNLENESSYQEFQDFENLKKGVKRQNFETVKRRSPYTTQSKQLVKNINQHADRTSSSPVTESTSHSKGRMVKGGTTESSSIDFFEEPSTPLSIREVAATVPFIGPLPLTESTPQTKRRKFKEGATESSSTGFFEEPSTLLNTGVVAATVPFIRPLPLTGLKPRAKEHIVKGGEGQSHRSPIVKDESSVARAMLSNRPLDRVGDASFEEPYIPLDIEVVAASVPFNCLLQLSESAPHAEGNMVNGEESQSSLSSIGFDEPILAAAAVPSSLPLDRGSEISLPSFDESSTSLGIGVDAVVPSNRTLNRGGDKSLSSFDLEVIRAAHKMNLPVTHSFKVVAGSGIKKIKHGESIPRGVRIADKMTGRQLNDGGVYDVNEPGLSSSGGVHVYELESDKIAYLKTKLRASGKSEREIAQELPLPLPDKYEALSEVKNRHEKELKEILLRHEREKKTAQFFHKMIQEDKELKSSKRIRYQKSKENSRHTHICILPYCLSIMKNPKRHFMQVHFRSVKKGHCLKTIQQENEDNLKFYLELIDLKKKLRMTTMAVERLNEDNQHVSLYRKRHQAKEKKRKSSKISNIPSHETRTTQQLIKKKSKKGRVVHICKCAICGSRDYNVAQHFQRKHPDISETEKKEKIKKTLSVRVGKRSVSKTTTTLSDVQDRPIETLPERIIIERDQEIFVKISIDLGNEFKTLLNEFRKTICASERDHRQTLRLFRRIIGSIDLHQKLCVQEGINKLMHGDNVNAIHPLKTPLGPSTKRKVGTTMKKFLNFCLDNFDLSASFFKSVEELRRMLKRLDIVCRKWTKEEKTDRMTKRYKKARLPASHPYDNMSL